MSSSTISSLTTTTTHHPQSLTILVREITSLEWKSYIFDESKGLISLPFATPLSSSSSSSLLETSLSSSCPHPITSTTSDLNNNQSGLIRRGIKFLYTSYCQVGMSFIRFGSKKTRRFIEMKIDSKNHTLEMKTRLSGEMELHTLLSAMCEINSLPIDPTFQFQGFGGPSHQDPILFYEDREYQMFLKMPYFPLK